MVVSATGMLSVLNLSRTSDYFFYHCKKIHSHADCVSWPAALSQDEMLSEVVGDKSKTSIYMKLILPIFPNMLFFDGLALVMANVVLLTFAKLCHVNPREGYEG